MDGKYSHHSDKQLVSSAGLALDAAQHTVVAIGDLGPPRERLHHTSKLAQWRRTSQHRRTPGYQTLVACMPRAFANDLTLDAKGNVMSPTLFAVIYRIDTAARPRVAQSDLFRARTST